MSREKEIIVSDLCFDNKNTPATVSMVDQMGGGENMKEEILNWLPYYVYNAHRSGYPVGNLKFILETPECDRVDLGNHHQKVS